MCQLGGYVLTMALAGSRQECKKEGAGVR